MALSGFAIVTYSKRNRPNFFIPDDLAPPPEGIGIGESDERVHTRKPEPSQSSLDVLLGWMLLVKGIIGIIFSIVLLVGIYKVRY